MKPQSSVLSIRVSSERLVKQECKSLTCYFPVPIIKGLIRKDLTIVKPEWIVESIKKERMLPLISESVRNRRQRTYP